jgi:hypothetical protein
MGMHMIAAIIHLRSVKLVGGLHAMSLVKHSQGGEMVDAL